MSATTPVSQTSSISLLQETSTELPLGSSEQRAQIERIASQFLVPHTASSSVSELIHKISDASSSPDNELISARIRESFGSLGERAIRKLTCHLQDHDPDMTISYNQSLREFTILNSARLDDGTLSEIIELGRVYEGWEPKVKGTKDLSGNHVVVLSECFLKGFEV
jgi:hypothetical protein